MDTLKGKRLLILGGNRISCEIVKRAQEMGIYVMVTDWYPIKNSPAKQIADEAFLVSTADVDAVVQLIKEKKLMVYLLDLRILYFLTMLEFAKKQGCPAMVQKNNFRL